jgi:hypothetical protein
MRTKNLIFVISIALVFISCSKSPENAASVEVVDGIELVHNTAVPLHPEKSLSLEEELAIGGDDGDNALIVEAGYFIVDKDGTFYIANRRDFNIKVFDKEGNYLHTIGKKGEGPGEFQYVGYITFLLDGRLLVMDQRAQRTSLFESSGEFISSHQWKKRYSQLVLTTNASYFVQELVREEGADPLAERRLVIDEIDLDGNEINSFGEFKLPEFKTLDVGGGVIVISVPHSPRSIFTGDLWNQNIYHCLNSQYLIEVYDPQGNILRKIDRPYEPLPFTSEDKKNFLARYERRPDERMKKLVEGMDFPSVKNVTSKMFTDDQGNLWIQTLEQREEGEISFTAFDIFDKDGFYDSRVWLDVFPEIVQQGKVYSRRQDQETGYVYLKRHRMIWSE